MSAGVGVFNTASNNNTRNYNHIPTIGGTINLSAYAIKKNGTVDSGATFTWASDNTAVATVNSSGLVTAVGSGVCNITALSSNGQGTGFFPVGVALLTLGASSITFGGSTTISCAGGDDSTEWITGTPGVIALLGKYNVAGVVVGSQVTIQTISGVFNPVPPPPSTATAHCPIDCVFQTGQTSIENLYLGTGAGGLAVFGGIYASTTLIVTLVPNWTGS